MSTLKVGPRTLAGLVVGLTFVVGGLAGAVMDRSMARASAEVPPSPSGRRGAPPGSPQDRAGREQHRERFVQQMTRELNLTAAQVAKIDTITRTREQRMNAFWDEVRPRIHAMLDDTRKEIDQVLTPEQRAKLQEIRRQHESRRRDEGASRDSAGKPR